MGANGKYTQIVKGVRYINRDEMDRIIDRRSRSVLGISGDEFIKRYHRGDYKKRLKEDHCGPFMELIMIAPAKREL